MIVLAAVALSLPLARATRPDEKTLANTPGATLRSRALDYAENPSADGAAALRAALSKAQSQGIAKDYGPAAKLNETQLKNFAKYIQVAEVCEVVARDKSGFPIKATLWVGVPTDTELANFVKSCKGAARATVGPAVIGTGAGK